MVPNQLSVVHILHMYLGQTDAEYITAKAATNPEI